MKYTRLLVYRLLAGIFVVMVVGVGVLTFTLVKIQTEQYTKISVETAQRVSDIVKRSTQYSMLLNRREDIYHKPHSLYFSRYPVGREATLDWLSVDMKFRNDSPYGVVLQAWTTGRVGQQGSVTVKV